MGAEENDNGGTGAGVRGDVRADRELETGQSTESDLTRSDLEQSTSPAERIARHWYRNAELVYLGVDFGKCMEYDTLQVINRSVVRQND